MRTVDGERAGLIGFAAGVTGALIAVVLLFWPEQVAEDLVSYPFTTKGFLVAQALFFVHHFGLLIPLIALARSGAIGTGRLARAAAWLAVLGVAMLTGAELLAMRYADWNADVANEGVMGAAYGIACTAVGVGAIGAGIALLRQSAWRGWHGWTPLVIGVSQFLVLIPGMLAGFVAARLAIGFWMLTFAAFGWAMYREAQRAVVDTAPESSARRSALPAAG